jgi:hypothetical protein
LFLLSHLPRAVTARMARSNVRIHFEAERNDGGIDLSISTDDRTVVVLKLSASELEEMVRMINEALGDSQGNEGDAGD